jgi:hypothetical protein
MIFDGLQNMYRDLRWVIEMCTATYRVGTRGNRDAYERLQKDVRKITQGVWKITVRRTEIMDGTAKDRSVYDKLLIPGGFLKLLLESLYGVGTRPELQIVNQRRKLTV